MRVTPVFVFLVLGALGAGCGEDATAEDVEHARTSQCRFVEAFGNIMVEDWPTIDGVLAAVARRNPGFGGFRIEGRRLVILMVDPTQVGAERVRDELERIEELPPLGRFTVAPQSTPYDYNELLSFYVRAYEVQGLTGLVYGDIDETLGRIEYGVVNEDAADCVRANLQRLDIPEGAAVVQLSEPIRPLGD